MQPSGSRPIHVLGEFLLPPRQGLRGRRLDRRLGALLRGLGHDARAEAHGSFRSRRRLGRVGGFILVVVNRGLGVVPPPVAGLLLGVLELVLHRDRLAVLEVPETFQDPVRGRVRRRRRRQRRRGPTHANLGHVRCLGIPVLLRRSRRVPVVKHPHVLEQAEYHAGNPRGDVVVVEEEPLGHQPVPRQPFAGAPDVGNLGTVALGRPEHANHRDALHRRHEVAQQDPLRHLRAQRGEGALELFGVEEFHLVEPLRDARLQPLHRGIRVRQSLVPVESATLLVRLAETLGRGTVSRIPLHAFRRTLRGNGNELVLVRSLLGIRAELSVVRGRGAPHDAGHRRALGRRSVPVPILRDSLEPELLHRGGIRGVGLLPRRGRGAPRVASLLRNRVFHVPE